MNCEQAYVSIDPDVVWLESNAPAEGVGAELLLSISELAAKFGITLRALRFYESKGLLSPMRDGLVRLYSPRDVERLSLVLKAKKLGFTLGEISRMIDAQDGRSAENTLKLSREKCAEQIGIIEQQLKEGEEALAELRRIQDTLAKSAA